MLAVRIEAELESRLEALARAKHRSKSDLVREAILRMLEDEGAADLTAVAQESTKSTKTLVQLRKELGLDG